MEFFKNIYVVGIGLVLCGVVFYIVNKGKVFGTFVSRFFPCQQDPHTSLPCFVIYDIYIMILSGIIGIILFCFLVFNIYKLIMVTKTTNNNSSQANHSDYTGKIGEIISYIDHSVIHINDVVINYDGKRESTPAQQQLHVAGTYIFTVSVVGGKSFDINWSTGTGDELGPSMFKTASACYELFINTVQGNRSEIVDGQLVLKKAFDGNCDNKWAKDLR